MLFRSIISDLHSNLEAVEAVFARIQELGIEDVVCLGDVVGYGADPLPVTLLVMKHCKWTIQGNHDWGMFHNMDDFNPLAREALMYTRQQLRPFFLRPRRRQAHRARRTPTANNAPLSPPTRASGVKRRMLLVRASVKLRRWRAIRCILLWS